MCPVARSRTFGEVEPLPWPLSADVSTPQTRFRHAHGHPHAALLTRSTTHRTVAAALRPHPGFGEAVARRCGLPGYSAASSDSGLPVWKKLISPPIRTQCSAQRS